MLARINKCLLSDVFRFGPSPEGATQAHQVTEVINVRFVDPFGGVRHEGKGLHNP